MYFSETPSIVTLVTRKLNCETNILMLIINITRDSNSIHCRLGLLIGYLVPSQSRWQILGARINVSQSNIHHVAILVGQDKGIEQQII